MFIKKGNLVKRKILFSILLCIGFTLPGGSFTSEPPSWFDWARTGVDRGAQTLYSYIPQPPNISEWTSSFLSGLRDKKTYAALIAALSLGYLVYTLQKGLGFTSIDTSNVYAPSNMRNIAIFLSHLDTDTWRLFKAIFFYESKDWNAANMKLLQDYVYPILTMLPQPITRATWFELIRNVRNNIPEGLELKNDDLYYSNTLNYYLTRNP